MKLCRLSVEVIWLEHLCLLMKKGFDATALRQLAAGVPVNKPMKGMPILVSVSRTERPPFLRLSALWSTSFDCIYIKGVKMRNIFVRLVKYLPRRIVLMCVFLGLACIQLNSQQSKLVNVRRVKCNKTVRLFRETEVPATPETEENEYITDLCQCDKEIDIVDPSAFRSFHWCSTESSVRGAHQKVVALSLYDLKKNYTLMRRYHSRLHDLCLTVEKEYPGWSIRIYHNISDAPGHGKLTHMKMCDIFCRFPHIDLCDVSALAERLANSGAKSAVDSDSLLRMNPYFYRNLVMLDPNVDVFLLRDTDSVIWRRETEAVNQWLTSNYTYHLMRDHLNHTSLLPAGM